MIFFDFHHHDTSKTGILNQELIAPIGSSCFSIGIHPKSIQEDWKHQLQLVKDLSSENECVAIGECGLDRFSDTELSLQKKVFKNQILLANERKKPVIIHCVRMHHELNTFAKIAKVPLVIHGFNKKETLAKTLLKQGFYLSFGKAILHRVYLQNSIKEIPLDKLFLETDMESINIKDLYLKVAELKQISVDDVVQQIEQNKQKVLYG